MKPPFLQTRIALFITTTFCLPLMASADESADNLPGETLETIVVSGTPFSQQIGTQKITEDEIAHRPATNPSITSLLKTNPAVRFSNKDDTSLSAGEISLPEISFHGEKFYNNNYTIDGFSNNDNINPGSGAGKNDDVNPDGVNPWELPAGGTQSLWINPDLLKNVEVFDSNISAKYGRFTGGVVNAEIKDPDLEKMKGKAYYRTTRDNWAKYHIYEPDQETFEQANRFVDQPQFTKHFYGVQLNQPFADKKGGILFAYDRAESSIPFNHSVLRDANVARATDGTYSAKQKRKSETFLLSAVYLPDNGDLWRAKVIYAPHESFYPKRNVYNGGMTNKGGGIQTSLEWEKELSWAKMKTAVGYKKTGNEVEHDGDVYRIYRLTPSIPYRANGTTVNSGGYGTTETESESYTLKQNYELLPFTTGSVDHKVIFGWQIDRTSSKYERKTATAGYNYVTTGINNLTECADECILGEQYANRRTVYDARSVKVNDSTYSVYVQDNLKWKNLETTVGLRFDRNQYLKNNDISPRFSVTYDVFGDSTTRLFGGLNRYYAGSMIAYKLRQGIGSNYTQTRSIRNGRLTEWGNPTEGTGGSTRYDASHVKTPYSDEKVLGLAQKFQGMLWTVKWVHRDGKDQFTRTKREDNVRVLSNDGWSKNDTFTLSVSPLEPYNFKYATVRWDLGLQASRSKTNNTYYDQSTVAEEERVDKVIYRGKLIDIDDLPPSDFNQPWRGTLTIDTTFPQLRLNWTQILSYTAGQYSRVGKSDVICPGGHELCGGHVGNIIEYNDEKHSGAFLLDWRFSYKQPTFKDQYLEFTLDVNNVLNKRISVSSTSRTKTYKMGRNFWFGVSYNW